MEAFYHLILLFAAFKINLSKFIIKSPAFLQFYYSLWITVWIFPAATSKSLQSCPTLCDSIDGSPPGSLIFGILQARTLEWVAISFSNASKWKVKVKSFSHIQLFATPWTAAYQAPPSMRFSRQEHWSGLPLPSPRGSSWPRDPSLVFCIDRRIIYHLSHQGSP